MIRKATTEDCEAINRIYNHYVLNSTCTFQEEPETLESRVAWLASHEKSDLPVFVAVRDGSVIAWASLSFYHSRAAYRNSLEVSFYVEKGVVRTGVGSSLFDELVSAARRRKAHTLVAIICEEQQASIRFHEKHGFRMVGRLTEVGNKFGRWLNTTIMQLML